MNGTASPTISFAGTHYTGAGDTGLYFMAGRSNNNLSGMAHNSTFGNSIWTRPDRLSSDAVANLYTRPSVSFEGRFDPWGLNNSPIIDDDERVISNTDNVESEIPETMQEAETGIELESAIPEAAAIGAAESTPWTLAAIVNQQLGQATSQAITTGLQNQQASDYAQNMGVHGLNVGLNADIIRSQQDMTIRNQQLGGTIGSFFGPIGALIGHAVAGYASSNASQLQTAGSFNGYVNPLQTGITSSMTTAGGTTAMEQVDNVDTGND